MAQYFRRISRLSTRAGTVSAAPSSRREGQTPTAMTGDEPTRAMTAEPMPAERDDPTVDGPPHSPAADGLPPAPRPRGRPRLEAGEDRKPMGHRVPSALLRQLTLVAAELAYLEDRKIQQQDLVAAALEEFIARQKIRIEQLRRERQG